MIFYHGSPYSGIAELEDRSITHGQAKTSVVYLTPNRAYALFYVRDPEINYVTCGVRENGTVVYSEYFPGMLEVLYRGRSGYLYKISDDGTFEKTSSNDIWIVKNSVCPYEAEYISDACEAILECQMRGEVEILRFDAQPKTEQERIYEMIKYSFYKNDIANQTGKRAEFYKNNFPHILEEVLAFPDKKHEYMTYWEERYIKG